jgi:hypothetical protein
MRYLRKKQALAEAGALVSSVDQHGLATSMEGAGFEPRRENLEFFTCLSLLAGGGFCGECGPEAPTPPRKFWDNPFCSL